MTKDSSPRKKVFTRYETFIIAILAIIQFTVILDFMPIKIRILIMSVINTIEKEKVEQQMQAA